MNIDRNSKSKIYLCLTAIGLILLFYSIWEIKPVKVDITDFLGLISHLTLAYWLGLVLVISLSVRIFLDQEFEKEYIYIILLFVYGLYMFGVPIFAEENARFPWSYYPAGEVKTILQTGYIDSISNHLLISYRSWPATHIISAYIINLTNINIEYLLKYMPLFWMTSLILTTFVIGRRLKFMSSQAFLLTFMVLTSFWYFHYYYGPQSMAYLLFMLLFMFIMTYDNRKDTILIILTFSGIVMTHMLTSIAAFSAFLFSSRFIKSIQVKRSRFIIFFSLIFIAWYAYLAPVVLEIGVKEFVKQVTSDELLTTLATDKYKEGFSLSRLITHYSRISFLLIFGILMTAALILYLKNITKNKSLVKTNYLFIIGISMLIVFKYGPEMDDRIYILSLIPMSVIAISSFGRKYLAIIMILFVIIHLPAHYGTESMDMLYTSELAGDKFFAEWTNVTWKDDVLYYPSTGLRFYNNGITFRGVPYADIISKGGGGFNVSVLNNTDYILLSKQFDNFMVYNYDVNIFGIKDIAPTDIIYTNGDFHILKKVM